MSDSEPLPPAVPAPAAERAPAVARSEGPPRARSAPFSSEGGSASPKAQAAGSVGGNSNRWLLLTGAVAVAGVVMSALLWQKLDNIQEELARRS